MRHICHEVASSWDLSDFQQFERSSRSQMFFKKAVKACNFIKKRLQRRCFPVNIEKFLGAVFLQNGGFLRRWLLVIWEQIYFQEAVICAKYITRKYGYIVMISLLRPKKRDENCKDAKMQTIWIRENFIWKCHLSITAKN